MRCGHACACCDHHSLRLRSLNPWPVCWDVVCLYRGMHHAGTVPLPCGRTWHLRCLLLQCPRVTKSCSPQVVQQGGLQGCPGPPCSPAPTLKWERMSYVISMCCIRVCRVCCLCLSCLHTVCVPVRTRVGCVCVCAPDPRFGVPMSERREVCSMCMVWKHLLPTCVLECWFPCFALCLWRFR